MPVENNILNALSNINTYVPGGGSRVNYNSYFEMRPDGSLVCCTEPQNNIVTLQVDHVLDMSLLRDEDSNTIDRYLKEELARKIAKQMIEEDLIQIQYDDDPSTLDRTYRATVKFIQE